MSRQGNNTFDMGSYNDVASRIAEFRDKYPDGRLRPVNPHQPYKVETIGNETFIVYTAAAYRTADDPLPGIGVAQEGYPGKTPYTRGSELQNAETSAWGRAIVAALASDTKKGIASAEDVRNRQAEREQWDDAQPAAKPPTQEQVVVFDALMAEIVAAQRRVDIGLIGKRCVAAKTDGGITPAQYHALDVKAGERIDALRQAEADGAAAKEPK